MSSSSAKKARIKAVAMLSGGLDSTLAVKVVADQGIDVYGVNFSTGFCLTDHRRRMFGLGADIDPQSVRNEALAAGAKWHVPVEIIDISDDYIRILTNPRYGYGSAVNPCIDCRIFMQQKAREYMEKIGAKFIVTGEVVGQRPMSQMRNTLRLIEKQSGCRGLILRPLSAKLLEPTIPEKEGWVDREKLHDFKGRGRKPQMRLAREIGLEHYPQPAGGCCFLTDKNYARRLQDLFDHSEKKTLSTDQVLLLKVGRHFRLENGPKLIVGRNEPENLFLEDKAGDRTRVYCTTVKGPLTLVEGAPEDSAIQAAAALTARYSDAAAGDTVAVSVEFPGGESRSIETRPLDTAVCDKLRI